MIIDILRCIDFWLCPLVKKDLIDWTKFAVFVRESELPIIGTILDSISMETLQEMQRALLIVRHSLIYPIPASIEEFSANDLSMRLLHLKMNRYPNSERLWDAIAAQGE